MMVGSILFAFLFLLSFVGVVGRIQAALLFNIKFANSLKRGRLLVRACTLIVSLTVWLDRIGAQPLPTATGQCRTPCSPSNRESLPPRSGRSGTIKRCCVEGRDVVQGASVVVA